MLGQGSRAPKVSGFCESANTILKHIESGWKDMEDARYKEIRLVFRHTDGTEGIFKTKLLLSKLFYNRP